MTAARLTVAQARRLGLDAKAQTHNDVVEPAPPRRRRKPAPYATVCHDCGQRFTTRAGETRHLNATGHTHYQLVLGLDPPPL